MGCYKLHNYTTLQIAHTSNIERSREGKSDAGLYKYKFQGQEFQDELGLNWHSFKWRNYDAAIGRFMNIDPLSEQYAYQSHYNFSENMVIHARELEGLEAVVAVYGDSQTTYTARNGETFVTYDTHVYNNMTVQQFNELRSSGNLPAPDYSTSLARDAHDLQSRGQTVTHSDARYGTNNETPPGTYFLFLKGTNGDSSSGAYDLYIGDQNGSRVINGPDGVRAGIAIHQYDPRDSQGCLTTCSGTSTQPVQDLINAIPDLRNDNNPVQIIIFPRPVTTGTYDNSANGTVKYIGTQTEYPTTQLNEVEVVGQRRN